MHNGWDLKKKLLIESTTLKIEDFHPIPFHSLYQWKSIDLFEEKICFKGTNLNQHTTRKRKHLAKSNLQNL